ncbi:MAG: ABC transporter ATP-binding protein [Actinomycetota bacterium]
MSTSTEQASAPRSSGDAPALELRDVVKRFGDVTAVDHVNFAVGRSEFFSLLGPSGCGKTTTLRMLAGFERPTEGQIFVDGSDASDLPPYRRDTNLVFQSYALFPHMTVEQNVAFGPERKKLGKEDTRRRIGGALETVQLGDLAKRYPRELSGGQQQRVALARALANRPAVLLLDEPLGALDLKLREEMQFELKRIQREVGISFVYVTHDQGEALTMSDRIAVMNRGQVEHLASPEEIYLRPASLFVAGFIGQASLVPVRLESREGEGWSVTLPGGGRAQVAGGAPGCVSGAPGVLLLRPEHLRISAEGGPNGKAGIGVRVLEETFQGAVVRYLVEGPESSKLAVVTPLDARLSEGSVGRQAWVSWDARWTYVLPGVPDAVPDPSVANPD